MPDGIDELYEAWDERRRARRERSGEAAPNGEPAPNGNAAPKHLLILSGEFVRRFRPPEYLMTGILQRRFLYSFTGRTGSGKTAITLLFAASVALGNPIGDIKTQQGRVVYFAGENPDDILYRWIAMSQHYHFDVDNIPVAFIPGRFKISKMRQRILQETKEWGPVALVVVDTSAAYYEGVEVNSNTEQAAHAAMMRGLIDIDGGPTVIVNCHPVKNASNDNLLPLGAGAFLNEVDGNLTCVVDWPAVSVGTQGKFRGPDFDALNFRLDTVTHEQLKDTQGNLIPTVIARFLSEDAKEAIEKDNRTKRQRLLAEMTNDGKASVAEYAVKCGFLLNNGLPNKNLTHRMIKEFRKNKLISGEPGDYSVHEVKKRNLKDPKSERSGEIEPDLLNNIVALAERRRTRDDDDDEN